MSTDVIHGGHINIIQKAAELGELTVGVLSDETVASYKRYPLLSCAERMKIVAAIQGVSHVVRQDGLSYRDVICQLKPDVVVHGDDWRTGIQQPIREETLALLKEYGGELVEFPYSINEEYDKIEANARSQLAMPDMRRVLSFAKRFRADISLDKPLVVMPTTYPQITENELAAAGINIVIYANHLLRAAYPAMKKCAERILECDRAQEASEELCASNLVSGL